MKRLRMLRSSHRRRQKLSRVIQTPTLRFSPYAWARLLFLRDLLRPASLTELKQLVATYAGEESDHARQLFHDSLHASLTCAEVEQILSAAGCQSAEVRPTSDRHWTASYRSPSR